MLQSVDSPGGSTLLHEMTSWPPSWKCDVKYEKPTPSIDVYLLEEQPCQISSQSELKQRSLRMKSNNKMSSDMRSNQFLV